MLRNAAGYALWEMKRNKGILQEIGIELVENKIQKYEFIVYEEWETAEFQN